MLSGLLELELWTIVSCLIGAGNWLCKGGWGVSAALWCISGSVFQAFGRGLTLAVSLLWLCFVSKSESDIDVKILVLNCWSTLLYLLYFIFYLILFMFSTYLKHPYFVQLVHLWHKVFKNNPAPVPYLGLSYFICSGKHLFPVCSKVCVTSPSSIVWFLLAWCGSFAICT